MSDGGDAPDGSYEQLRRELGEQDMHSLVSKIGTMVMSSGVEASGLPVPDAVMRVIGSLTPGERVAIAAGATLPPRVQALFDNEVRKAEQLRQQHHMAKGTGAADDTGLPGARAREASAAAFLRGVFKGRDQHGGDYSGLRSDSISIGKISPANYAGSDFARAGLSSYPVFDDLRQHGFNAPQIMAAVKLTRSLGIDTNRNAAPVARLQRDAPETIPGLHQTRDNWRGVRDLETQARERGDMAAAQELDRRAKEARDHSEAHDKREREQVQRKHPDRVQDHRRVQQDAREAGLRSEEKPENKNYSRLTDCSG